MPKNQADSLNAAQKPNKAIMLGYRPRFIAQATVPRARAQDSIKGRLTPSRSVRAKGLTRERHERVKAVDRHVFAQFQLPAPLGSSRDRTRKHGK